MNKSVLFLATLFVISFCSSSKIVSMSAILDKLVQLNQAAGKDHNDIGLLVSQVSQAFKENGEKFDEFYGGLKSGCTGGSDLLKNFNQKLEADIIVLENRSNEAESDNKKLVESRGKYTEDMKKSHEELKALGEQIKKELEEFKVYGSEAETKLVIIKTLRDIITDELLGEQKGQSFIQLQTFNDKLRELKSLLSNSKDGVYAPLVSTLLALAEGKGFSDQKILQQILEVLGKLEKNLREFRDKQNKDGKENIKNLKNQAKEKKTQIKSLFTMIADANSNIQNNETIIKTNKSDVAVIKKEIERKQGEGKYWDSICEYQSHVNESAHQFRSAFESKLKNVNSELLK